MQVEQVFDLEQQKLFLKEINSILKKQTNVLQNSEESLKHEILEKNKRVDELEIDKKILQRLVTGQALGKSNHYKRLSIVAAVVFASSYLLLPANSSFLNEPNNVFSTPLTSRYVIENLQGDTIDTWMSWRLSDGGQMTVNIVNSDITTQDKIDAIKDTILSDETMSIDDSLLGKGPAGSTSLYYKGWMGALGEAGKQQALYYIPATFNVLESSRGEGDITITLTNLKDADGYSGYTKSITNENQILKSSITIYDVDNLTSEQIATITRHEFGHALGLAHSTATEDLMAPSISTPYPFVSDCDIDALVALYNGQKSSKVVCEK